MVKRLIISIFIFAAVCLPAVTQDTARVKEFSGKVQFKEGSGGWQSIEKGTTISLGSTIATSFNSTALLDLGSSELFIKALTSMTIENLMREENKVTTSLKLNVGRVSAKVKTGEGLTHDFKLQSSYTTAAVRGTEFDFDGVRIITKDGVVTFYNKIGQKRTVLQGQQSTAVTATETPVSTEVATEQTTVVEPDTTEEPAETPDLATVAETIEAPSVTIAIQ